MRVISHSCSKLYLINIYDDKEKSRTTIKRRLKCIRCHILNTLWSFEEIALSYICIFPDCDSFLKCMTTWKMWRKIKKKDVLITWARGSARSCGYFRPFTSQTSHNITDHNPTRAKIPLDQRHTSETTAIGNYKTSVQENRRQQLPEHANSHFT